MNTGNIYMITVGRERRRAAFLQLGASLFVLKYDRPICMTSALNNLNCLEAATVIHRQSITAKFTRSDVVPIVCEERL